MDLNYTFLVAEQATVQFYRLYIFIFIFIDIIKVMSVFLVTGPLLVNLRSSRLSGSLYFYNCQSA